MSTSATPTKGRSSRPRRIRLRSEYEYTCIYKACASCRRRKIKCEPAEQVDHPCSSCAKLKVECQFDQKRRYPRRVKVAGGRLDTSDPGGSVQTLGGTPGGQSTQVLSTGNGNDANGAELSQLASSANAALDILFQAASQVEDKILGDQGTAQKQSNWAFADLDNPQQLPNMDALGIWETCPFVRMGWLTAHEAFTLVDLFYKKMASLSPILSDFYANPHHRHWLVSQEPVLCCTILLISSRNYTLPGQGGPPRGDFIHNRLWNHCQHLILCIMLGHEKVFDPKTRHLSSIEALLLLLEWYPRALPLSLENDEWDSDFILNAPDWTDTPSTSDDTAMSNRWKEDVIEQTKQLDQTSWMLVSNALALAHELGVFGHGVPNPTVEQNTMRTEAHMYLELQESRRRRLPSLLFVFVNLIASRIGCPSLLPEAPRGALLAGDGQGWESCMASWVELTRMMRGITERYFPPTRDSQQPRGWDSASINDWREVLNGWLTRRTFRPGQLFDDILHIESQYLRVFINFIEMQFFVEEVVSEPDMVLETRNQPNEECSFLTEVIAGSCAILEHIILISPKQEVQYLPSRTFLRVIGCSVFLLKALALGARETTIRNSLSLLDQTLNTLQTNCPADMHLVSRYAGLMQTCVSLVRERYGMPGNLPNDMDHHERREQHHLRHDPAEVTSPWDGDLGLQDSALSDNWLSMPLDPLTAPCGVLGEIEHSDHGLESVRLNLDFIWNIPS